MIPPINDFISKKVPQMSFFGIEPIQNLNRQIISKTNDWGRFLFSMILILGLFLNSPDFKASYNSVNSQPKTTAKTEAKQTTSQLLKANPVAIENMKAFLNPGYELVNDKKVYYTKSADFAKVYFFGTLVINGTQIEPCIWVTNLTEFNNIMSVNEGALNATPVPDASKSDAKISWTNDGYLRIEEKLLSDKTELSNNIQKSREDRY